MMLNPSVFLSLIVVLSESINVRAISDLREKRSRGFPQVFGQECQEGEGFPSSQDCSFQEACRSVPLMLSVGRFSPRLIRHQQEVSPPLQECDEEDQHHQYPTEPQHRWRSPLLSRNPQLQFSRGRPEERRGPMGIVPRCPPFSGLPPGQRLADSKTSRRGPFKFPSQDLTPEPLRSRSMSKHGLKKPNNFPPEWRQRCTSQNQPFGEHHEPFGEPHRSSDKPSGPPFRHDICSPSPTTPKPSFFYDFMPKYVETVPPPTCPISPSYEPPPKSPFEMSGHERISANHHPPLPFDNFSSNDQRCVQPKQY
ncbi:hypothetical protein GE061_017789 [Apolygus lucorum]|uniref:Uncharacterized protein n=1 Tax=Apolygus lucorum TaxID=248454 RepID=A0A6A4IUV2_APOLU|nr:hypothetical protein GE061_017789 [Apolygus lucorum]